MAGMSRRVGSEKDPGDEASDKLTVNTAWAFVARPSVDIARTSTCGLSPRMVAAGDGGTNDFGGGSNRPLFGLVVPFVASATSSRTDATAPRTAAGSRWRVAGPRRAITDSRRTMRQRDLAAASPAMTARRTRAAASEQQGRAENRSGRRPRGASKAGLHATCWVVGSCDGVLNDVERGARRTFDHDHRYDRAGGEPQVVAFHHGGTIRCLHDYTVGTRGHRYIGRCLSVPSCTEVHRRKRSTGGRELGGHSGRPGNGMDQPHFGMPSRRCRQVVRELLQTDPSRFDPGLA